MTTPSGVTIRRLTSADIDFGMQLKNLAGWNQLRADWERFIEWEPEGCFLAEWEGRPAGTATTTRYQDRFGWVGMVLVHPDMRRKGIGTALLMACIEYLESEGVAAVKLDATPAGKPLYDTLGFADEYGLGRREVLAAPGEPPRGVEVLTAQDVEAICRYDAVAFGADRSRVLRRLCGEPDVKGFLAGGPETVRGYVLVRPGMNASYIGPWVAEGPQIAEDLLRQVLIDLAGKRLFIDVSLAHAPPAQIVAAHGFLPQRTLTRMFRGANAHPGRVDLVYGVAGPEMG